MTTPIAERLEELSETVVGRVYSLDFDNKDYTLVTFRVPVESRWAVGDYAISSLRALETREGFVLPSVAPAPRESAMAVEAGRDVAPPEGLHGPHGWLVIDPDLDESHWELSDDPACAQGVISIPLYSREDPFSHHKAEPSASNTQPKAETQEFYIVWNEGRNEGFVTDDIQDAESARTGRPHYDPKYGFKVSSTVGDAFYEAYEDDTKSIETIRLPATPRVSDGSLKGQDAKRLDPKDDSAVGNAETPHPLPQNPTPTGSAKG